MSTATAPLTAVPAYAAPSPKAPLEPIVIRRRPVGEHDVLIEIQYCGICHSDVHQVNEDWGRVPFPMVPGHEIAGIVAQTGPGVSRYAVGDRVGVGFFTDSCRSCENCLAGEEQFCARGMTATYPAGPDGAPAYGGYSTHIVVDENYVLRLPESIGLAEAAPLLCAGITVYSPLNRWQTGPGQRVAILGMGGLGHLGVKIAHAMGAEVTVLSRSPHKRDDALRLGASAFSATGDPETYPKLARSFDLIINTVSAGLELDPYLSLLTIGGTLVNVGAPGEPSSLGMFALIGGRRSVSGSMIGGMRETQEMLDFCAEHGIGAEIETIGVDGINETYERMAASDVRYRFVLDATTLRKQGSACGGRRAGNDRPVSCAVKDGT